jgi:serine protease Do
MQMNRTVGLLVVAFTLSVGALLGFLAGGGGRVPAPAAIPPPARPSFGFEFADIVERVNPAVVHIAVLDAVVSNPHEDVEGAPELEVPERGEGSGFLVDALGHVLTNHHLVSAPGRIRVRLADRRELPAQFVGSDPSTDLALLKIDAPGLLAVPLGDSDSLRVGDWVAAIGNPLQFEHSVTVGVVSSKGRKIFDPSFDSYIQTDAAINPGNSGGPLINARGEAVGISSAVSSEGQGIGFAVPINMAKDVIVQLKATGRVSRGFLGVQLQELDPDLRRLFGLKDASGAMVVDVVRAGAGEAAGLKRYDVIAAVSGEAVRDGDQLIRRISALAPGSTVTLRVIRDGRELSLPARLEERAPLRREAPGSRSVEPVAARGDALGLVVTELSARQRSELQVPADKLGVAVREIVGLDPGADALEHGDLVVEVNRRPTPTLLDYEKALAAVKPGEGAWLLVFRPRPEAGAEAEEGGVFLTRIEAEAREP